MKILLSIVIPTKDRYEVLFPTIRSLLGSLPKTREIEIVVQDNSLDNSAAVSFLEEINDERLIYRHVKFSMPVSENSELAISAARGEFVTFIGDDDLVSPYILDVVRQNVGADVNAVIYPPAYFWWPSVKFKKVTKFYRPGALWYPLLFNRPPRWVDTKRELERVLSQGCVSLYDLPRLYHGIVRRSVLDALRLKSGRVIHGASPDMACAIALALSLSKHLKIDFPLTIFGASKGSGGGLTAEKRHFGVLEEQSFLPKSTINGWSEALPRVWSEGTIYPQTAYEVFNSLNYSAEINYSAFYASIIINEAFLMKITAPILFKYLKNRPLKIISFAANFSKKLIGKLKRIFNKFIFGMPYDLIVFQSSEECVKYLSNRRPIQIN